MVQLLLAFTFGALGLVLLLYAIVRWSQRDDRPLSPARRAWILGGLIGAVLFLLVLAWWAWVAPPDGLRAFAQIFPWPIQDSHAT